MQPKTIMPVQYVRPAEEDGRIKILVINETLISGGIGRFLLNFLKIFPEDRYQIDLQLLDNYQDGVKMLDKIPHGVRILPPLRQFLKWSPELMEELRRSGRPGMADIREFVYYRNREEDYSKQPMAVRYEANWIELEQLSPVYKGYDYAVAMRIGFPFRIAATRTPGAKKYAFIHMDYKSAIAVGHENKELLLTAHSSLEKMDRIFCVTNQNRASLLEYFPLHAAKIEILQNISDPTAIKEQAGEFYPPEYPEVKFIVLTAARVCVKKCIDRIIITAANLKKRSVDFRWFIMGNIQSPEYARECQKLQKELGLSEEDVVFLGGRPNPYPYIKNCGLYVQPSLHEGRSLAVEEAMILNCAIVTTDYPSTYDQITDGVNGRVVPNTPEDLAGVICALSRDEQERKRLADANKAYSGDEGKEEYYRYFS